ncbi:MAG: hypothetical protein AAF447_09740 [Myxococcota bacterium]
MSGRSSNEETPAAADASSAPRVAPTAVLLALFVALAVYGVVTVMVPGLRAAPEGDDAPEEAAAASPGE